MLCTTLKCEARAKCEQIAFDTVAARYGNDLTQQDEQAAKTVHAYWAAFTRTGKPEVAGQPSWPAYQAPTDTLMDFTNTGPVVGPDPWKDRLDLVERFSESRQVAASDKH